MHYYDNNCDEVNTFQLLVIALLHGLHNIEFIVIYGVKGLPLVATIIKVVVLLQCMNDVSISTLVFLKAMCITIANYLSPFLLGSYFAAGEREKEMVALIKIV